MGYIPTALFFYVLSPNVYLLQVNGYLEDCLSSVIPLTVTIILLSSLHFSCSTGQTPPTLVSYTESVIK